MTARPVSPAARSHSSGVAPGARAALAVIAPSPARHRLHHRRRENLAPATQALAPVTRAALGLIVALIVAGCTTGDTGPDRDGAGATTRPPATEASTPASTAATPSTAPSPPPPTTPELDAIARRYHEACRSPGAAVSLRRADGTIELATAGELAPSTPLTADSQLLAGSVTKLFVGAVALQLVAEGRLDLDETVAGHLPDWPRGAEITVEMLLGHRSGMGDYGNDFGDELRDRVLADLTREYAYDEVLDLVRAVPRVGEPGGRYHYSNANTIVLGAVVRHVTGQELGPLFDERIVAPLGLAHTVYGPDDLDAAAATDLHGLFDVAGDGELIDIGPFPRAAALTIDPAGAGLISTLPDLLVATGALFGDDSVLAAPERQVLSAEVSTIDAADLLLDGGDDIDGHGGVSPGTQVLVAHDHGHDTTVAVWCNRLDPGPDELLPSVLAARETLTHATDPAAGPRSSGGPPA